MVNRKGRLAKRRAAVARAQLCKAVLSFQRGMVLVVLMLVGMVMLKRMGVSNSWASCGTALLALPFALRFLLRPVVDGIPSKGWCMAGMQLAMSAALWFAASNLEPKWGGTAMWICLAFVAVLGAFHDVMAEDFCNTLIGNRRPSRMLMGLSMIVLSLVLGLGVTLMVAGDMEVVLRNVRQAWQMALKVPAGVMLAGAVLSALALPGAKIVAKEGHTGWKWYADAVRRLWKMPRRWVFALFIFLISFQEMLVAKGVLLFMVDPGSAGGLSLGPHEAAFAYGTAGGFSMLAGLLLGYWAIRRHGLRRWAWPMAMAVLLPDALLLYLAYYMPSDFTVVCECLSVECFGCGFAMSGLVMYLRYYGYGRSVASYWHSCLSLIALAMLAAGAVTGFVQDYFGYRMFFVLVISVAFLATLSLLMLRFVRASRRVDEWTSGQVDK